MAHGWSQRWKNFVPERKNGRLVTLFMSYTPEREYSQPTSILFSFFTLYFWNGDNSTLLEWDCIHLFIFALSSDGVSRTCLSTPHLPMKISETRWIDPNPQKQGHLQNRQSQKHLPQTISETCWSNQWQPCCNVASPPSSNANPRNRFIFQWQFQKNVDLEQIAMLRLQHPSMAILETCSSSNENVRNMI